MAADSSRKRTRRRPTRRAMRAATAADTHYSRLTRRAAGSTDHAAAHPDEPSRTPAPVGASSYVSLSHDTRRRVYGTRAPRRHGNGTVAATLLGLAVVVALLAAVLYLWMRH